MQLQKTSLCRSLPSFPRESESRESKRGPHAVGSAGYELGDGGGGGGCGSVSEEVENEDETLVFFGQK